MTSEGKERGRCDVRGELMKSKRRHVVVGVTGPGENSSAMLFAADQAHRLDAEICLVHAIHDLRPPPAANPLMSYDISWDEVGNRIVDDAAQQLKALDSDVPTRTLARHGDPVHVLSELSGTASMLVLQHRDLSAVHRVFTGSTVAGVASHAQCPVTSVPAGWLPSESPGRVTVGVHEDGLPASVVAHAFAQAAARQWSLCVAHAWRLDPVYDDIVVARDGAWRARAEAAISSSLHELRQQHPDVPVDVEVRHQWPADALVELSTVANLLVVGRHRHHVAAPRRLGSVARALLRTAGCPVTVVPV
jgi:nucleotide-binding universal stress UspA family protein